MEYNLDLLLNCFKRFANYIEKNNSKLLIKIENDIILYCNNYQYNNNIYQLWCLFNLGSLKEEIEYFFFGTETSMSFFEWFCYIDLLKPFGKPCCLEELVIKMDLMGV
jgi:hypothetical protein